MDELKEEDKIVFSRRLRALREKKGVSKRVLADFCVTSKTSICRYERGERLPDIGTAARMADYFDVSMDYLCGKDN